VIANATVPAIGATLDPTDTELEPGEPELGPASSVDALDAMEELLQ
jgi:hypothetical protein